MRNAETYQQQFFKIVDPAKTTIVRNGDWFSKLNFTEVTKLMSQITVAQMLEREEMRNIMPQQLKEACTLIASRKQRHVTVLLAARSFSQTPQRFLLRPHRFRQSGHPYRPAAFHPWLTNWLLPYWLSSSVCHSCAALAAARRLRRMSQYRPTPSTPLLPVV
jgi:hypothetical protein